MNLTLPDPQLCVADEATFWPWFSWPDFANWPNKDQVLVVVPIAGFCDWELGESLDCEERVLMAVLKAASQRRPLPLPLLVLPPLRFTLGPSPRSAFAVDPDTAAQLIEEVVASVGTAGFSRIVLFNASPWTEELCKAVGRDLRIALKLQMFSLHLSALGLDLNPVWGGERLALKKLLAALCATPGDLAAEGAAILGSTAEKLVAIFSEMAARPPLANGGGLASKTWP